MSPLSVFCPRCHRDFTGEHRFCPYDGETIVSASKLDYRRVGPTRELGAVMGDRYEVRGFVGKGAMAKVYLAEDRRTGDLVAIKLLDRVQARSEPARSRFFREARAAALLRHPNIVRILDVGIRDDGVPFLVLEFLFGESLGERLRRDGTLPPAVALPILRQAAAGLAAAHAGGVVHRDVKPDNVFLVGEPGDPYLVKLVDFGLARFADESGFTQSGTVVGTMEYMAPEQILTERPDARTDVYGLGVVMYRVLAGALPITGADEAELLARQLVEPPPPLAERDPALAGPLDQVVRTALRKRPDNRHPSMAELLADLERVAEGASDELFAGPPHHEPDMYVPTSSFARHAAQFFYRKLGRTPPDWDADASPPPSQ
jgi:serine/threonine-protein kinase